MATAPEYFDRNPGDDAEARLWVAEVKRRAESGQLQPDGDFVTRELAKERAKRRKK